MGLVRDRVQWRTVLSVVLNLRILLLHTINGSIIISTDFYIVLGCNEVGAWDNLKHYPVFTLLGNVICMQINAYIYIYIYTAKIREPMNITGPI
jgi:hypothetical protein